MRELTRLDAQFAAMNPNLQAVVRKLRRHPRANRHPKRQDDLSTSQANQSLRTVPADANQSP